ncbi:RNA polymerase sigma factor [Streptomyces sp. NPDC005500]|uniref:RNA polymerase sigma factor n=1 Tax=Streptomyces sp. NPDC005500 TaxID=3155007 RepID=UPI0033B8B778
MGTNMLTESAAPTRTPHLTSCTSTRPPLAPSPVACDTGAQLAERFRQGDEAALVAIYHRHSSCMFTTAMYRLKDPELAAEAVQQAFIQAWQAAASFQTSREMRPWLRTIVRRTAVDTFRRERPHFGHLSLDVVSNGSNPELPVTDPELEKLDTVLEVRSALSRLRPEDRQVIQLTYYHGYTQREISRKLGIAVGTVNNRITRARRHLTVLLRHLDTSA